MPHNGCPHQCSFCNQKSITGQSYQPTKEDVTNSINIALESLKDNAKNAEIAFFGGSFTAIDRDYMLCLLDATKPYIDKFRGIRISTRPDYIYDEVLAVLKEYKVTSIELGAQSMNDEVLLSNDRGHLSADVYKASKLIKEYGFSLGLQMMTGLYKSTPEIDFDTAKQFVDICPDTVRVYPTIIMKNTKLHSLYDNGMYTPYSMHDTIELCTDILQLFDFNNINVIRVGLHHSESLQTNMIAGPYHPAFRELCESEILYRKSLALLSKETRRDEYTVCVSKKSVSKMIGNKKCNIKKLNELGYNIKIIQSDTVNDMDIILK